METESNKLFTDDIQGANAKVKGNSNNICLGLNAGLNLTTENYCLLIGEGADVDDSKRDGQVNIYDKRFIMTDEQKEAQKLICEGFRKLFGVEESP